MYLWDGTELKEYTGSSGQSKSTALISNETLYITSTSNENDEYSFLKVKFNVN